jgi:hypothetical protein
MASFTWLATEDALSPAMLTVRAQAIPPNDQGELLWDMFFPREDVDSVDLWEVTTLDYRPVSDRREWNARGRYIPTQIPTRRRVSIVPIEARNKIDELEMQRLRQGNSVNSERIREIMMVAIPNRVDLMAQSNYRRLELDAIQAWTAGTITQRNPEDASKTYTASFGFSGTRITTAPTAWNDAGVNAYDLFLAWIFAAQDLVGPVEGAMMRLATFNAILADAPNLPNSVKMTRTQVQERIQQDLGSPFTIYINENSHDVFTDGGTATTRTKAWPAQKVAAIPAGRRVGRSAFAPVIRAMDLVAEVGPSAGIDVRGQTVYYEETNSGKELNLEVQVNALPVPDEQKVCVIDAGV